MDKKTICGYAWTDVYTALSRSIGNGDMKRAQRWAAELLCSDTGVSRLEAVLFSIWSEHVGTALAKWPSIWQQQIAFFRDEWMRSGGDNKVFRNKPLIRNRICECVSYLVIASKRPRPSLPKSTDVFKEAEVVRAKLRNGEASPDQPSTKRVWDTTEDAPTMRTLGNELEASIRTAQTSRALFWLIWIMTLDGQKMRPNIKERAPTYIHGKNRKSLSWFILALLSDIAKNGLDTQNAINEAINCIKIVWVRLGSKYRKETIGTIIVMLCERVKSSSLEVRQPREILEAKVINNQIETIDSIYEELANDMNATQQKQVDQPGNQFDTFKKEIKESKLKSTKESSEKMETTYNLMRSMYGMDNED